MLVGVVVALIGYLSFARIGRAGAETVEPTLSELVDYMADRNGHFACGGRVVVTTLRLRDNQDHSDRNQTLQTLRRDYDYKFNPKGFILEETISAEHINDEVLEAHGISSGTPIYYQYAQFGDLRSQWNSIRNVLRTSRKENLDPPSNFSPMMVELSFVPYSNLLKNIDGRRVDLWKKDEDLVVLKTSMTPNGYEKQYYKHTNGAFRLEKMEAQFSRGIHVTKTFTEWRSVKSCITNETILVPHLVTTVEDDGERRVIEIISIIEWDLYPVKDESLVISIGSNTQVRAY